MKLSLEFLDYQEESYEYIVKVLASVADLRAMQNSIKDILDKYVNYGTTPIRLHIARDDKGKDIAFKLEGTYYEYAVLYQKIQAKINELQSEVKNTH